MSFCNLAASQFCYSRSNKSTTTLQFRLLCCKVAWLFHRKVAWLLRCKVAWLLRWKVALLNCVASLRDCYVARLRYCCVARLRDCCVARLRYCCVARLHDCAMLILWYYCLAGKGTMDITHEWCPKITSGEATSDFAPQVCNIHGFRAS
jgi:hypothetical protein